MLAHPCSDTHKPETMQVIEQMDAGESSSRTPTIYVVVPTFNRISYTEMFLSCLRRQTFTNFQVILVDDGSTDGTAAMVEQLFPEVHLIKGDGNLWWTGAINVGIKQVLVRASDVDAVLVINDDLEVDPDYFEVLHRLMSSMPNTLIGSVVVDIKNPDIIENGGVIINWLTAKHKRVNSRARLSDFAANTAVDVSYLTGRGTLIPVRVFHEIGLYDDKHFQQCGDTELPVRAGNHGYRLVVSYAAVVKSHISASDNMNVAKYYSIKDFKPYFFGMKSNCRLKYHLFFSLRTAQNPIYFISYFLCNLVRISYHFVIRLRFNVRKKGKDGGTRC